MGIRLLATIGLLLLTSAGSPTIAGVIRDVDVDGVPDALDNCVYNPNGPSTGGLNGEQRDTDDDSWGDACDCDFTQDNFILGNDYVILFAAFNTDSQLHDVTGDGLVLGNDVIFCFSKVGGRPSQRF